MIERFSAEVEYVYEQLFLEKYQKQFHFNDIYLMTLDLLTAKRDWT